MSERENQQTQGEAFLRRRVLEEVRARLEAVTDTLSNLSIDAGELREDANELTAIVRRINWLADVETPNGQL